jgi:hypothetical protein
MRQIPHTFCTSTCNVSKTSSPIRSGLGIAIGRSIQVSTQTGSNLWWASIIVAQFLHRNRNYVLFYRGQSNDYKTDGKTTILPSIYRKKPGEKRLMLKERFENLQEKTEALKSCFETAPSNMPVHLCLTNIRKLLGRCYNTTKSVIHHCLT